VSWEPKRLPFGRRSLDLGIATFFIIDLVGFAIKVFSKVTKLPIGLRVSGAVGNIATFVGAFAECVPFEFTLI